jgi:hypothetical protein
MEPTAPSGIRRYVYRKETLHEWRLVPDSRARVLPVYVPQAVRDDYLEACRIETLSPKAESALSDDSRGLYDAILQHSPN